MISRPDRIISSTSFLVLSEVKKFAVSLKPLLVLPGRLSVSRTFGDIEAKLEKYGGKPGVVIAQPEIAQFML